MKGQKWILAKQFSGVPTEENLKLVEYDLPDELQPGEILLQAVYLSVDPYMRIFKQAEGDVMQGEQLSEVIKSKNGEYPIGTLVLSKAGWQSHYISDGKKYNLSPIRFDLGGTPISYTLGSLGMPGATAYIGLNACNPKPGEIVIVTAAAGAVGSIVGQLAKIKGCTVIGFVGSDDKVDYCKNELGFDHVFNYKKINFSEALSQVAPDGADIYFDNVGGEYYHTIINKHLRKFGRVLVCGSIETYNDAEVKKFEATNFSILINQITVTGFMVYNHYDEWPLAFTEMNKLINEGKLKVKEAIVQGIENMRDAFYGLFKGENIGKVVIKAKNTGLTHYP